METDNGIANAKNKLKNKNADYVVLNYANKKCQGFNSNTNHVYLYSKDGSEMNLEKIEKIGLLKKL